MRGKQLDIQRILLVIINRDHTLAVIVQILQQDLTQRVDLARVRGAAILARQETGLGFQVVEEGGHFGDDGLEGGWVGGEEEDDAEVENVLVAVVGGGGEAYRMAEDAVFFRAKGDGLGAEGLAWDYVGGVGGKVEEGLVGRVRGGDDGVVGDLVEDSGAFG